MDDEAFISLATQAAASYARLFPPLQSDRLEALRKERASLAALSTFQDLLSVARPLPRPCIPLSKRSRYHAVYVFLLSVPAGLLELRQVGRRPWACIQKLKFKRKSLGVGSETPNV